MDSGGRSALRALHLGLCALGIALALWVFLHRDPYLRAPCDREDAYYCIRVDQIDDDAGNGLSMRLVLDRLNQSRIALLEPTKLTYSYIRAYAEVTQLVAEQKPNFRSLMIGGGGYALPRYLEAVYPQSDVHVIEIDPNVVEISHQRLGLHRDSRIQTHIGDARPILAGWTGGKLDVIYDDAFHDLSMPYHLTTVEFDRIVYGLLSDDGVYMANVIDDVADNGTILRAFYDTFSAVFPRVYVLRWGPYVPHSIETLVVMGVKGDLDVSAFEEEDIRRRFRTVAIEGDELDAMIGRHPRLVLSDDYAPTDQLTAPLFEIRG